MDLPHQGLLNVANLRSHNIQLALKNVTTLAVEMGHHDIPLLVLVVLPPVPLKLFQRLLDVVETNGEVVHGSAMGVVEIIDPLNAALQVLDPLLNLDDSDVESAMVNSLVLESSLQSQHLLFELLDALVLASDLLSLRPALVGQMTNRIVKTLGLGTLSRDIVGHLSHLLLQAQESLGMTVFVMGQGIVIFITILGDNLISCSRVRVTLTLSSAKAYHFKDVQFLCDTPDDGLRLSLHPTKETVHQILETFDLLRLKTMQSLHIRFEFVHLKIADQ